MQIICMSLVKLILGQSPNNEMVRFGFKIGLGMFLCRMLWAATIVWAEPIPVFVSIIPQKTFVEKIGGHLVDVSVMVPPGANPATYEPKPSQMVALSRARIFYAVGVPFEKVWLSKMASVNPEMRIVHTERGVEKMPMATHIFEDQDLQKGTTNQADKHDHGVMDPHIWLSPPLVMVQARNILTSLLYVDPENRSLYETNYRNFILEIVTLDEEILRVFANKGKDIAFIVFHPAWGYFAEAYGLRQIPIEIEGKEPKPAQLRRLIEYAREKGVKVVFVQPQFSTKSAKVIAEAIGGQVVFADPLAPDWSRNLQEQAKKFKDVLE